MVPKSVLTSKANANLVPLLTLCSEPRNFAQHLHRAGSVLIKAGASFTQLMNSWLI